MGDYTRELAKEILATTFSRSWHSGARFCTNCNILSGTGMWDGGFNMLCITCYNHLTTFTQAELFDV